MSHVWREVVEREKGSEQLPHLATQGPRPMGVWLGCGFAHVWDPPCHSGGHSLGSAEPLALRSAYLALSFKKLPLPLLTSSLRSGALGPLRPPLCLECLSENTGSRGGCLQGEGHPTPPY